MPRARKSGVGTDAPCSIPAIIGGAVGGLGFIAIVCAAALLLRPRRREIEVSPFENPSAPMQPPSDLAHTAPTRKWPLDVPQGRRPLLSRPFRKPPLAQSPLPIASQTGATSSNWREDPSTPYSPPRDSPASTPRPPEPGTRPAVAGAVSFVDELPPSYTELHPQSTGWG